MMTSSAMGKSSVIRIREVESLTGGHSNHPDTDESDDDCSNPFMNDDVCTDSVLRCSSISSLSSHDPSSLHHHVHHVHHHVHCQLLSSASSPSSAVKKDVNLSSTSCIEVIKRESFNRTSHGHLCNSSSHHLNSEHHSSSLLNSTSTLDAYCESPSFLLDSTTDSSPTHTSSTIDGHSSHSSHHHHHHHHHHVHGHHSSHSHHSNHHSGHHHHHHHHLVVGSDDDDADVDESSNDVHESIVSGRVSRMSTETVPDTDLMFSCSGVLDPRDVTVVTPSSIMGDSIVTGDDTVAVSESIGDHHHSHHHSHHHVSPVNIISSVNDTISSPSSSISRDDNVSSLIQSVNVVNDTGVDSDTLIASGLSQSTASGLLRPLTVNNVSSNGVLTVTTLSNGIQGHHQLTNTMSAPSGSQSVSRDDQIVSHNSVITTHSIVSNGIVNVNTAAENVTSNVVANDRNDNSHNEPHANNLNNLSNASIAVDSTDNNHHPSNNSDHVDDDPLDTFDIKQEKLDDVGDVTECILRDPPLNHLKTSPCRSYIVSSVQRPLVVTTCASSTSSTALQCQHQQQQQQSSAHQIGSTSSSNIIISSTNSANCLKNVLPDSSTSVTVTSNNPLLTNATVSSTTTSSLQHVTSNETLLAVNRSTNPTLRSTLNNNTPAGTVGATTAVVLTTSTTNNSNTLRNQTLVAQQPVSNASVVTTQQAANSSPLDIKILPAGLIQLASNLAAVFPASNLHKQQIAIQLLREDGTSIILPITTRGATVALNTSAGPSANVLSNHSPANASTVASGAAAHNANDHNSNTVSILTSPTTLHGLTLKSNSYEILQTNGSHNHSANTVSNTSLNQTATIITTSPLLTSGAVKSSDINAATAVASSSTAGTVVNANGSTVNNGSSESDRPFKCELCNSTFTRLGNYTRHKKIHSLPTKEDQRFRCDICSKSFIQRCDLARHLHIHRGTEPHRCPQCGKGYIRHSDLVTHQRFHNKEKPFACPHCSKGFCQRGDLNRHLRSIHLQLKPILCTHCHKKFAKEETLLRHINSTHRDKLLDN